MKKIFSFLLIAAGLMIGTNAKAIDFITEWDEAVVNGGTIILDNNVDLSLEVIEGNELVLNTGNEVIIDLNGFNIDLGSAYRFMIDHGTLTFEGKGVVKNARANSCVFKVMGSDQDVANYSILNIGKEVTVKNDASDGWGILAWGSAANSAKAFGVVINIDGKVYGGGGAITINGNVKTTSGNNFPVINVNATAEMKGTNTASADEHGCYNTAIYCSGYGVWNIKGYVEGATGIYVKAGVVNLDGAMVVATGERNVPQDYGNGPTGSGDAIVYDTNSGYAGKTELHIKGNTSVYAEEGYAINEVITKGSTTEVIKVEIQSGDFNGAEGGIVTTDGLKQELADATKAEYSISGGTFNNEAEDIMKYLVAGEMTIVEVDGKQMVVGQEAELTERPVVAGNFGTICYEFDCTNFAGAMFFQIAEASADGLQLEEVATLEAGKPYIFLATASKIVLEQGQEVATQPEIVNHLVGSFEEADIAEGKYIILNNKMTPCGTGCKVGAHRAYIDLDIDGAPVQARRVGGRTISMGADAVTAMGEVRSAKSDVMKMMQHGRLVINHKGIKYSADGKQLR